MFTLKDENARRFCALKRLCAVILAPLVNSSVTVVNVDTVGTNEKTFTNTHWNDIHSYYVCLRMKV